MRNREWVGVLGLAMLVTLPGRPSAQETQPAPASQAPANAAPSQPEPSTKQSKKKNSHANDFLIRGTVFNEKGLAFPGALLRIRRAGEKKFRWQDFTNSRGEFAIRVKQGADYEVAVESKNFGEQTRAVNAATGAHVEELVFHMEPAGGKK